jgi:hypothetical protein
MFGLYEGEEDDDEFEEQISETLKGKKKEKDINKLKENKNVVPLSFSKEEKETNIVNARSVYRQAVLQHYKSIDDLAIVWCAFIEV